MIAIIATGGKQYLVKTGETLKVEKLLGAEGDKIVFDKILMTANDDGSDAKFGNPYLSGVTIETTLVKQGRAKRILVEKYKRKVRYHKARGHRQHFTAVEVK